MKKVYNNIQQFTNIIIYILFNQFIFRAFNCFIYDQKIKDLLVASYLLKLLNYYILLDDIKFINLDILQKYFLKFVLYIEKIKSTVNDLLQL